MEDTSLISDADLEDKIKSLTKKYFAAMSFGNGYLAQQAAVMLEGYKQEYYTRQEKSRQQSVSQINKDLDDLINVG